MEPITVSRDFKQFREELLAELNKAAGSFCRIGYLLKQARDTDILKETSYSDVYDFATSEFGLEKTQVSRFININNRFSINGNSEQLLPEYAEYGVAKLSLMLTLPDEINEELSPEYSKSDIQAIKDEYDAEQKITPLEVMAEPAPDQPETDKDEFLALIVKQLNDEHPTPITLIHQIRQEGYVTSDDVTDAYRPDGDKVYIIRVSGQGRFTVTMKADKISIVNARTFQKSTVAWEEWMDLVLEDEEDREFKPEEIKKAKETTKKKVEKSAASVQKTPESVQNPEETDKKVGNAEEIEIEKVEGEVIDNPENQQITLPDDNLPFPETATQSTEEYRTSEDAGQCMDDAPQEIIKTGLEPETDKDAGAAGEDETVVASEDAESEAGAAGDEDVMIDKLEMLVSPTEVYKIREMVRERDSIHGYRESLDRICGWIADLHTITNRLYAKLASRGM